MPRTWVRAALILASIGLGACERVEQAQAQTPGPAASTQPKRTRPIRIIPWLEVNRGTDEEIDNAVSGLLIWRQITDTAVVSTEVGRASIYSRILPRVPGMQIIPGLKTAPRGARFDSLAGWQQVADEVRRICAATGQRRYTLDSETPLKRNRDEYWNAKVELDFAALRRGLELLPRDAEVWWYPGFVGSTEVQYRQSERLARLVQDVLNVRFVTWELARPPGRNNWWNDGLSRLRDRISRRPALPIIYFYFDGKYWPNERIAEALSYVSGDDVLIYPGARDWVDAAETITKAVQQAGIPLR